MYTWPESFKRPHKPLVGDRRRHPSLRSMLDNVPEFADMAELDAYMESHKNPSRWDRHDGMWTEAEWVALRRSGEVQGSGHRRAS